MNFSFLLGERKDQDPAWKIKNKPKAPKYRTNSGFVSATLLEGYLYWDFLIYFAAKFDVGKKLKVGIYRYLTKTWNASFAYYTVAPITNITSAIKPQRCSEIQWWKYGWNKCKIRFLACGQTQVYLNYRNNTAVWQVRYPGTGTGTVGLF